MVAEQFCDPVIELMIADICSVIVSWSFRASNRVHSILALMEHYDTRATYVHTAVVTPHIAIPEQELVLAES